MCPTVLGRVQTRWAILIIPAIIWTIVSLITGNPSWIILIGLYFVIGVALDTAFYPFVIRWQPPWLTFVLAVGEFILVYLAANVLHGIHFASHWEPIAEYWITWVIAIWTKVVILPLLSLSWTMLTRFLRWIPIPPILAWSVVYDVVLREWNPAWAPFSASTPSSGTPK